MFQKKQMIYSETQGVCQVENIVQLSGKNSKNSIPYYVLRSVLHRDKVAYIPVDNHQVELRELFTVEEAQKLQKSSEIKENEQLKEAVEYVLQNGGKIHGTTAAGNS